jgi:hypothetical protein
LLSGWLAPGRPALWPVQYLQQEPSDLSYGTMKKRNQKERLPAHITEPRNRRSARSRRPVPRRAANIKKKGRGSTRLRLWFGYPADTERRWERDATPDLLLKHPDATLATYVWGQMKYLKHASETLTKTLENHVKHIQHSDKTFAIYVWNRCKIQIDRLATYVWKNSWNIGNKSLQYMCTTVAKYATSWYVFATST